MPITTFDGFIESAKQYIAIAKLNARAAVATGWFSQFDIAGTPGPGVAAGANAANGVVPTDNTAGCPVIDAFAGPATGYLAQVDFGSSVACRMQIMDMLFKAGTYSFAAATSALTAQPSYVSRVLAGNYKNTQIWIEVTTAFLTGTAWQVQVTYTNQDGVAGRSTTILPSTAAASLTQGRMYRLGLQAGDSGVQKIDSVIVTNGATAMTAGAFNVLVLRALWTGRSRTANDGDVHDLAKTGMPVVFADSALVLMVAPDSTSTGVPEVRLVVASG
jgi:hypothetical protein